MNDLLSGWQWETIEVFIKGRRALLPPPMPPTNVKGSFDMASAKITWTDPTMRSDGTTALTPAEIAQINVFMSSDNGNTYTNVGHAAAGQQSFTQPLTTSGTYLFKLQTVDTQTPPAISADSSVVSLVATVPLAAPNPPSNVAVVAA